MRSLSRREVLRTVGALGVSPALNRPLEAAAAAAPASVATMRFSKYEVMPVLVPMAERVRDAWTLSNKLQGAMNNHNTPVFVRLHTDAGIAGVGEALMSVNQAEATLKRMIGRSPWEFVHDDSIGGMLMAVYDVLGQATGLPACRLLSASPKERIVHTWWSHCLPPKLMASEAKLAASLGYRVHKVKARPWQDPVEQGAAICEVVPKEYRVWADANAWWGSAGRAMFFIRKLAELHNYFAVESPIAYRDVEGFRQLKGKCPLRLADHMGSEPMVFLQEGLLQAWVIGVPWAERLPSGR